MSTPEFQAVEREMAPKLAAFGDQITQNEKLFERIAAVYDARETRRAHPRAEAAGLALLHQLRARRAPSSTPPAKKRLSEINQRLATLYTSFSQNVLADETDYVLVLETEADLAGLPDSVRAAAAAAAAEPRAQGQVGDPQHPLQRSSRS